MPWRPRGRNDAGQARAIPSPVADTLCSIKDDLYPSTCAHSPRAETVRGERAAAGGHGRRVGQIRCYRRGDADLNSGLNSLSPLTLEVWRLRQQPHAAIAGVELVGDADFELVPHLDLADLVAHGLDGTWLPHGYDVIGPEGHIEVVIDFDDLTGTLTVEVGEPDPHDREPVDPVLAILPKA